MTKINSTNIKDDKELKGEVTLSLLRNLILVTILLLLLDQFIYISFKVSLSDAIATVVLVFVILIVLNLIFNKNKRELIKLKSSRLTNGVEKSEVEVKK